MAQAALLLWAVSLPYCTGWLYRPDLSKFTWVSKFLAAAQIFTISCENSKILSRLLSVLSLHRKFVHDHFLLSKFSYHTHSLLNGGHPWLWARLPKSVRNPMGVCGGGLASAPLPAHSMRVQVAPGCTAANLILLSIQCLFPFPPPFSVSQQSIKMLSPQVRDTRWCSPPWRCCPLLMQSPSDWLPLAAPLLWVDSLPYCTGSFVLARHAEMSQNIGVDKISAPTKISLIFAKL